MIKKCTLLLLACVGFFAANAQKCGFDQKHSQMLAQDPNYASTVQSARNNWIAQNLSSSLIIHLPGGDSVYEIPVVIHVVHTGGAVGSLYNPTDAQLTGMINYLNQSFEATWPSYAQAGSGGTRIPLRFTLAKRDPNCAATTGIVRVDGSGVTSYTSDGIINTNEVAVKALSRWPNTQYYNIWVVNKIDGADGTSGSFTAGYAYFPGASPNVDGTVILATQAQSGRKTMPHEIGHAFSLHHTFEDGDETTCPPTGPCATTGDEVCDTEPHRQSPVGTCPNPVGINICTGLSLNNVTQNFMDYSNCPALRFTPGQHDRVMFGLLNGRASLASSLGATALPVSPLPVACAPTTLQPANVQNLGPRDVTLNDLDVTSGGYNTDGNQVYIDNSCKYQANLIAGQTYPMTVRTSGGTSERLSVFIDYNNNGVFEPAASPSELIYSDNGIVGNHNFNYTVPSSGPINCTPLRMRVMSDGSTFPAIVSCGPLTRGQAEDYSVVIKGSSTPVTGAVNIAVTNGGNPSCFSTTVTLTATPGTGIPGPTYKWFVNNNYTGITASTFASSAFANNDVVTAKVYFSGLCGPDSALSNAVTILRAVTVAPVITNTLTGGALPTCIDDSLTFSATNPINPGGSPTYSWTHNGVPVGVTTPVYKMANIPAGTVVRVVMTSSSACAIPTTAISNGITVTHTTKIPVASLALTGGTNPGCPGQTLTFAVTPTTGGTAPVYNWKVNGAPAPGATNSPTYSGVFANGDAVTVEMTSNSPCAVPATVTSNTVFVVHNLLIAGISITQTGGTNPICSGKPATFAATPTNAGASAQFQWMINGNPVLGANSILFTTTALVNNDNVTCVLTATDPCVSNPVVTSNTIVMNTIFGPTPTMSINVTEGSNPGCLDSTLTYTAVVNNLGVNPNIVWILNGSPQSSSAFITSNSFQNGDVLVCRANQTDGLCYAADTIFSTPITLVLSATPPAPVISLIGNMLVGNNAGNYVWVGPNGPVGGEAGQSFHPGTTGMYHARFNNNGCLSPMSNALNITLLDIQQPALDKVNIYPNPTTGQVVLDWGAAKVNATVYVMNTVGQALMQAEVKQETRKNIDLSAMANGVYFVMIKNDKGESFTVKVTLTK